MSGADRAGADTAPAGGVPEFSRESRPILFVDGCCVLCQRAACWVAHHDRRGQIALAAQQGTTAQRLLPASLRGVAAEPGSVVWRTARGKLLVRSTAVLATAMALGGWYRLAAAVLWLVPAPLRDALYLAVARRRRRWFGVTAQCRMPNGRVPNRVAGSVLLD